MNHRASPKNLRQLTDDELLKRTHEKSSQERELTAEILKMLQEIGRRKLFAVRGYPSLFSFCVDFLGYSEAGAQRRVASVRLMNQLPEIEEKIRSGDLTLSNIAKAQSFFMAEAKANHPMSTEEKREILKKLEGKTTRQAERELLAQSSAPEAFSPKDKIRPVTATLSEIKFHADQTLLDLLDHARGLLAHKNPNLSLAELITEVTQIAIHQLEPKKPRQKDHFEAQSDQASTPAPEVAEQPPENPPGSTPKKFPAHSFHQKQSRYRRKAVERLVYHRDGGTCTYVDPVTRRRCGSKFGLEYDHVHTPFARGGKNTVDNLTLRCRNHNLRNAIDHFGLEKMEKFMRKTNFGGNLNG